MESPSSAVPTEAPYRESTIEAAPPFDAYSMLWDDEQVEQPPSSASQSPVPPTEVLPPAPHEQQEEEPPAPTTPNTTPNTTPSSTPNNQYIDLDALAASHPDSHLPSTPAIPLPPTAIDPAHEATLPMDHTLVALQARLVAASKAARATSDAAQRAGGYATAAFAAASQASDAAQRANNAVLRYTLCVNPIVVTLYVCLASHKTNTLQGG